MNNILKNSTYGIFQPNKAELEENTTATQKRLILDTEVFLNSKIEEWKLYTRTIYLDRNLHQCDFNSCVALYQLNIAKDNSRICWDYWVNCNKKDARYSNTAGFRELSGQEINNILNKMVLW